MTQTQDRKFSWCPVCMIHTYHEKIGDRWLCRNNKHELYFQKRTDPWIQKIRREQDSKVSLTGQ